MVQHQGPIPHPALFAQYETAVSGAGDRILSMAEESLAQNRLKMTLEHKESMKILSTEFLGMLFALIVALAFGGGGVFLIATGHEISGSLLTGATIVSVVTAFIKGRQG